MAENVGNETRRQFSLHPVEQIPGAGTEKMFRFRHFREQVVFNAGARFPCRGEGGGFQSGYPALLVAGIGWFPIGMLGIP